MGKIASFYLVSVYWVYLCTLYNQSKLIEQNTESEFVKSTRS